MPAVNWDAFEGLPGGAEFNFEMLCRALIRRHHSRYGDFAALAAQPGVEFHLRLHTPCDLGDPGRWYGWQCRWYDLPGGRALGGKRRAKIEEAIATTKKVLPELTDWVLWTRRPLTAGDQQWFYALATHMRLHLWTGAEVEEHLSGNAEILRGTYFGELVLTPDILADLHEQAVAPIRRRWQPEVHQTIDAERVLRRMLGETDPWNDLRKLAAQLEADAAAVDSHRGEMPDPFAAATVEVAQLALTIAGVLSDAHTALDRGDLELLRQQLAHRSSEPVRKLAVLSRQLRAARHQAALFVTNLLADIRSAYRLLDEVDKYLGTRLVAVLADAGCGKTQLAAQLTATIGDRPAGILLHGSGLHAGHNLDALASNVVIQGKPVPSMEALVAAVDAAGQRAHRHLPIVIDGLNEAEDPRDWKNALASLHERLRQYPYVLVICTSRTAFAGESLPPDVPQLEIPNFDHDTVEAVRRYFRHYRIDPGDAELPWELLSHPLTLRLFCEVTNPTRERRVGIEAMPESLTALFDRYLKDAADRIAQLAPRTRRYFEQDVHAALDEIGRSLWEENARSLELLALRRRLNDDRLPWNESIVRALEQDGILLRVPGDTAAAAHVMAVYDALAGHLVADALLAKYGHSGLGQWLSDPAIVTALTGPLPNHHPLATDTFRALVGLVPRRLHRYQLWQLLDEPARTAALREAAALEASYLDCATVNELAILLTQPGTDSGDLLDRLRQRRGAPAHPLNAEFLDTILRPMSVADRDLHWTEWIRRRREELLTDLQRLEHRWQSANLHSRSDHLRARWVMWILTSTVRQLRDQATRTLYWFGCGDPAALFDLTVDALAINDSYVPERLLAASYGVAMAHQFPDSTFDDALAAYLVGLRDSLTGNTALHPTNHWLARGYVQGTVSLACTYHHDVVPEGLEIDGHVPFAPAPLVEPITSDDVRALEVDQTLHMDFENYTLGRLFRDRRNYVMSHSGHQAAVAHVRGTVWALGWRASELGHVDKSITSYASRGERPLTERYGKKYGWIAYFEMAGYLRDQEAPAMALGDERISDVDIDPSFPEEPPAHRLVETDLLGDPEESTDEWIRRITIPDIEPMLIVPRLLENEGPWVMLNGYLTQDDTGRDRSVVAIIRGLLVYPEDADQIVQCLQAQNIGGFMVPDVPHVVYTYAGEIPWYDTYPPNEWDELRFHHPRPTATEHAGKVLPPTSTPTVGAMPEDQNDETEADDTGESSMEGPSEDGITWENEKLLQDALWNDLQRFPVLLPVTEYGWEPHHSTVNTVHGVGVPARQIAAAFDLRGRPQTFDLFELDGRRVSLTFGLQDASHNAQQFTFFRRDLLDSYLETHGLSLIWAIWCERQHSITTASTRWRIQSQEHEPDWADVRTSIIYCHSTEPKVC